MKLGLGVLTLINVALTCFGVTMAMMSPMLFDSGGQQDQLLWASGVFSFSPPLPLFAYLCPGYFCGSGGRVLLCSQPPFRLRGLSSSSRSFSSVTDDVSESRLREMSHETVKPHISTLEDQHFVRSHISALQRD
jgi:hypothetical protein